MRIQHFASVAAVAAVLIFALATTGVFVLDGALFGDASAVGPTSETHRWEYALIASFGALVAWVFCVPITLRLNRDDGSAAGLLDRAAVPPGVPPVPASADIAGHAVRGDQVAADAGLPLGAATSTPRVEHVVSQLVGALERAEADIRAKTTFLANMSHELRTPLNAIIGFSDLMQREYERDPKIQVPAKHQEYVRDIHNAGQYLLQLVNDILDLAKIESGADSLHDDEIEVAELINEAVTLVQERAARCETEIRIDVPASPPLLRADKRRVKQIFVNLLTNAVKFTPPGGLVTIKAWCSRQSGYVFQVSDNGIGMTLADIPKALTPFQQVDNALARRHDGAGIGLPLAKTLMETHGGSLDLQSRLGQGTTVTIRFPAERVAGDTGDRAERAAHG